MGFNANKSLKSTFQITKISSREVMDVLVEAFQDPIHEGVVPVEWSVEDGKCNHII